MSYSYSKSAPVVWDPIDALKTVEGDIMLLLIKTNSVMHLGQNTDPVFSATVEFPPIACVDQYQVCNPNNDICSPLGGSKALSDDAESLDLDLNAVQRATVGRIALVMTANGFHSVIFTRTQSFLRAQERVASLTLLPLPSNQWEIDMAALFLGTLSFLQHQIVAYPTGPPVRGNITIQTPWNASSSAEESNSDEYGSALEAMCHTQRVRLTQGTLNFSLLGLALLLGITLSIVVASYLVELVVGFIQTKMGRGVQAARRWARDDSLQVMRLLFVAMGVGEWEEATDNFPRTKTAQWFEFDETEEVKVPESTPESIKPDVFESDRLPGISRRSWDTVDARSPCMAQEASTGVDMGKR
ncbi:hypothetical protein ACHAQH_006818 [Verticillium albo-atrum]